MSGPSSFSSRTHAAASPTKLKLILPPLTRSGGVAAVAARPAKAGASSKGGRKGKTAKQKGPPRPPKLKPLKEVLTRLIGQVQKKDAYGFFLQPVDLAAVPGYTDVVRRPMDFGTIASKVARGKYRSLDDFAEELRLVTQNAKVFNPPGSIYHTEADRIEAWAAEHVAKAAPTVIEFEADWHVQVDGDDEPNDGSSVDSDEDEDARPPSERATSSAPQDDTLAALHAAALASGRRPPQRAAVKKIELERQRELEKEKEKEKHAERPIDNALDEEGHMPGYKDGVGVFPPHDDWAPVMLALKLKDKRYKTKKERMRIEKEGLPRASDGSLDYWEIEDPYTLLESLVPEPDALPQLASLFAVPPGIDSPLPAPAHVFLKTTVPTLTKPTPKPAPSIPGAPRKYWTLSRSSVHRSTRVKDREDTLEPAVPAGLPTRPVHAADYGGFATLVPRLAAEAHVPGAQAAVALAGAPRLLAYLRASADADSTPAAPAAPTPAPRGARGYWTDARARDAAEYVRDVVYGGPDGLAYARSVAEFVSGPAAHVPPDAEQAALPLGKPLPEYVLARTLGPLTGGRLTLFAGAGAHLAARPGPALSTAAHSQLATSAQLFPHLTLLLLAMRQILAQPVDLAHLLRVPSELLGVRAPAKRKREDGEADVEGAPETQKRKKEDAVDGIDAGDVEMKEPEHAVSKRDEHASEQPEETPNMKPEPDADEPAEAERDPDFATDGEFRTALKASSELIVALEKKRVQLGTHAAGAPVDEQMLETLRLGLLRLARAVPVDQLAKLPPELVPPEVRHIVPTQT